MYNSIRAMGLADANRALEILSNDPKQLEKARSRFSRSPPSYRSYPSGTTTQLYTPSEADKEQSWLSEQRFQLSMEYRASLPASQFDAHIREELRQIDEGNDNNTRPVPIGMEYTTYARNCVKKRWVEQGIWNKDWKWRGGVVWRWKHEEPPEPELEVQKGLEAEKEIQSNPLPLWMRRPRTKTARAEKDNDSGAEDDEETRQLKYACALREHEREASRPFHQFVYQVSREREQIQQQLRRNGGNIEDPADINTRAYEGVKKIWMERKIWDKKWGMMPGMSWKHEQPFEEWIEQEMSEISYPGPITPPRRDSPVQFSEMNLTKFRSVPPSPAELNPEVLSTNMNHPVPMVIDAPGTLDTLHNDTALNTSRHTSPPSPSKEKRPRGRPRKAIVKSPQDLPTPESPVSLRRSKRLQEAKATTTASDTVAEHRGRGRPKRSGTKAEDSAHGASTTDSRALKRRALKQSRARR
ncbi:hypothetical protein FHL15_006956 [Xylaria flabelliformis]|uniref:Uncharacterized protein n=1 Tax=Xylaria flabelliformis TaxID=2512241 RepID=A0A553HVW1_9PEZI|nr:hypothetical protein FHL15_006956 [Xylaria flabelliformis]